MRTRDGVTYHRVAAAMIAAGVLLAAAPAPSKPGKGSKPSLRATMEWLQGNLPDPNLTAYESGCKGSNQKELRWKGKVNGVTAAAKTCRLDVSHLEEKLRTYGVPREHWIEELTYTKAAVTIPLAKLVAEAKVGERRPEGTWGDFECKAPHAHVTIRTRNGAAAISRKATITKIRTARPYHRDEPDKNEEKKEEGSVAQWTLDVRDTESAKRIASALENAIRLCGGKKDTF